jgi:hypothetical protein
MKKPNSNRNRKKNKRKRTLSDQTHDNRTSEDESGCDDLEARAGAFLSFGLKAKPIYESSEDDTTTLSISDSNSRLTTTESDETSECNLVSALNLQSNESNVAKKKRKRHRKKKSKTDKAQDPNNNNVDQLADEFDSQIVLTTPSSVANPVN